MLKLGRLMLVGSVWAGLFSGTACGGSTDGSSGTGGSGGGNIPQCGACTLPLIHEGDACASEGECCSYGGVCPLLYSCTAGVWKQEASSNCGLAVPCGDQGLGCASSKQCIAEPSPNGTSYSCGYAQDAGADVQLPACGCLPAAPTIGEACACSGACGYLICPAGEMHTIDCVGGKWTVTMNAWDYYCPDAG